MIPERPVSGASPTAERAKARGAAWTAPPPGGTTPLRPPAGEQAPRSGERGSLRPSDEGRERGEGGRGGGRGPGGERGGKTGGGKAWRAVFFGLGAAAVVGAGGWELRGA